MPLWYPQVRHVAFIRQSLAARFFPEYEEASPSSLFGRLNWDAGLASLESALALPHQPYYRGLYNKAGALLRSMIKNHPFVDGNKRIGIVTTFVFLMTNRHLLMLATNPEMVHFARQIAESEPDMPWQQVADWIRLNSLRVQPKPSASVIRRKLKTFSEDYILERAARVETLLDSFREALDEVTGVSST